MKLLFVADLHYSLKQFDWLLEQAARFDPIVIGGDLLDLSSRLDIDIQITVVEKYLRRISRMTRLLVGSGNHDGDTRNAADESVAEWLQESREHNLSVDGDSVDLDGTRVTICPWWDGPVSRAALDALLTREAASRNGRWIWIHHAPPAGSPVCWTRKGFIGDEALLDWIHRFQPDMVLSGHIHNSPFYAEGAWADRIGATWVFNPGRQVGPRPSYIILDLEAMTAEWTTYEEQSVRDLAVAGG